LADERRRLRVVGVRRDANHTTLVALVLASAALAYRLFVSRGRLLLRIDELERELGAAARPIAAPPRNPPTRVPHAMWSETAVAEWSEPSVTRLFTVLSAAGVEELEVG
jgi:hypothetical protein